MARIITKQHAERIAKKLKATYHESRAHKIAEIFHGGVLIASFGIRHGSEKDQGHDHVQDDLHVNGHQAKLLAACPLTLEEWIQIMRDKGFIDRYEPGTSVTN